MELVGTFPIDAREQERGGVLLENLYVFDKALKSNMKLILSFLLYMNKYYDNRIIKVKYLTSLLNISETTVSRELKNLKIQDI